jgi:predicted PurR-regulated permease PerM
MTNSNVSVTRADQVSWVLAAAALIAVIKLHLLSALFAGMVVYELVYLVAPLLRRRVVDERARVGAVIIIATLVVAVLSLSVIATIAFFRSDAGSLSALLQRMAEIIEGARESLPPWVVSRLPGDADELRQSIATWLRMHTPELQLWGTTAGRVLFHILIGMIIGAMASLREVAGPASRGPLAAALNERTTRFGAAFRRVVFAQGRIAAINTAFTAAYLLLILPAFDIRLPFTPALIGITFLTGLLPVVGNIISNSIIVVVSFAHSPELALISLGFLVAIHKLEYFLNARIIGGRINARAWELLIAMLAMEAAFGIAGAVAAPVYYAYLKQELSDAGLL